MFSKFKAIGGEEGVGIGVGIGETVRVTSGAAADDSFFTIFPLLQTSFALFLMHLNSLPIWVLVTPFLLQGDPALGVLAEEAGREVRLRIKTSPMRDFLTPRD
jgi:hypothetical protein